ncbi:MAG: hypothetical protein QXE81_03210 [Desulfurococcaceae archaeon]
MPRHSSLILLFSLLMFSTLLRLVYVLYSNMPLSNDVWPLIEITSLLRRNNDIKFFDLFELYGHHVKWPFSMIYSLVFSITTDIPVLDLYKYLSGFINGLSIALLTYVLGLRIFQNKSSAYVFALSFSMFPSYVLFTSQFLKETYALIIMLLILFLFQLRRNGLQGVLLLTMCVVSLLLGHVITLVILSASLILSPIIKRFTRIWSYISITQSSFVFEFLYGVCLFIVGSIYNFFILKTRYFAISLVDICVFGFYILGILSLIIALSGGWLFITLLIISTVPFVSVLMLFTGVFDLLILLFIIPFPLVFFMGLRSKSSEDWPLFVFVKGLLLMILTLALYFSTYLTIGLSILHRFLNYLVYPFAFYLVKVFSRRYGILLVILLLTMAIISSLLVVMYADPLLFYWKYNIADEVSRNLVKSYADGVVIYGDVKYSYMDSSVFSTISPSSFVNTCKWLNNGNLLIFSRDNLKYGFPLSPIDYLKPNTNIFKCSSLLLNTGSVFLSGY